MFAWLHSWEQVSNAWPFCAWERGGLVMLTLDSSYSCFVLHCCCRHGGDTEQGSEMWPFRVSAETLHRDLPVPWKTYMVLSLEPNDVTHGGSSSSHDFRIQSHLFTCDSHVYDHVFQAHVNNMWSILRSYDPHKPMCPKPSVAVPVGYPTLCGMKHYLYFFPFSHQNSDEVQYCGDSVLN